MIKLKFHFVYCIFFYLMFFKKKRSTSELNQPKQQYQVSPLPKLQELTKLEAEMVSILGKKNIMVDVQADIFTRLEQIYINSLQSSALGMEMLQKCLRIIGEFDSPIRVNFLYFYAHEMKLKGAAVDQVEPVLLESFHSNLSLKNKVQIGFKSGLTFCQISQHSTEVDKILSSLIISLEHQLGYRPHKKVKAQPVQMQATKAIYLGTRFSNKSLAKHTQMHNKIQRCEYYKYLFEAFITGSIKIKSEAKRKYYADCAHDLKKKIIREYPGIQIDKKLQRIEQQRHTQLTQFCQFFKYGSAKEEQVGHKRSTSKTRFSRSKDKSINRSKSQIAANSVGQSLKNSFCRDEQQNTSSTFQPNTWATPSKTSGFKFNLRKKSKRKITQKQPCQTLEPKQQVQQRQQARPQITKLVFKQIPQNTKGIILKFDRLPQSEVKKKKLSNNFRWQKQRQAHRQNQLQHVLNVIYLPQIKEEPVCQKKQTSIKQQSILQVKPLQKQQTISQSILGQETINNHKTISQINSSERIDRILEEGVQWVTRFQSQIEYPSNKPSSNYSECDLMSKANRREQQNNSKSSLEEQKIEQSIQIEKSYKIIIQLLQKPQINVIVVEEIYNYITNLNEIIIENLQIENMKSLALPSPIIQITQRQVQLYSIIKEDQNSTNKISETSIYLIEETDKYIQNSFAQTIVLEWLMEIEKDIINNLANQANNTFIQSCTQVYLIKLNQEIQNLTVVLSPSVPIMQENQSNSSSFDDIDKSSQMSSHSQDQEQVGQNDQINKNKTYVTNEDKHQMFSQFSKIQMQKQTGQQWRSQINLMNQFFISDYIEVIQQFPNKQVTHQQQHSNFIQKSLQNIQAYSKSSYKTEQQIESKTRKQFQKTTRSQKKQSTHICLTIRYNDDYDKVTQQFKTFKHWLSPKLNINNSKLTLTVIYSERQYGRQQFVPSFISINDEFIKEISLNIQSFLIKFPINNELPQQFSAILKEYYEIDLLPEEVQIKPYLIVDQQVKSNEIRCSVNMKTNKIIFQSQNLTHHPIHLNSKQQLDNTISKLTPNMMFIKNKELIVKNVWSFISKRIIKYNSTHHFIFDFLQRCREDMKFDYEIRQQKGESFKLQGIDFCSRGKILMNIDTIIGFCLKIVNNKIEFHTKDINLFLNIL